MKLAEKLDRIPRGNTCPGVNRAIVEALIERAGDLPGSVLDIPSGNGDFIRSINDFYPESENFGADINKPVDASGYEFVQIDAQNEFALAVDKKFDAVTCISGVMEFDNTLQFFRRIREMLNENGVFVVTNDNLLSVRDRINYLLFGRYRQYRLFIGNNEPTWKTVSLHNLLRILDEAGFAACRITYVPVRPGDWLWLPLAAPIYFFQLLYLLFAETDVPVDTKTSRYPFASLLSRHYIVVCEVKR